MAIAPQPHVKQPINVVLFGEPSSGKSALVNIIARRNISRVSSGTSGYTLQFTRHDIVDMNLCILETAGLREPEMRGNDYLKALEKAYGFADELSAAGGVHLLLFCIRPGRLPVTTTVQNNYLLFSEVVFQNNVPLAFVITGLERETEMEDWWTRNKAAFVRYGLDSDGHACVTTVTDGSPLQDHHYLQSQRIIRELLKSCWLRTPVPFPDPHGWFLRIGHGMRQFVDRYEQPSRADVMTTLVERLRLDTGTAQVFLDVMERGGGRPSIQDSAVRSVVDPSSSSAAPRHWPSNAGPQAAVAAENARSGFMNPGGRDIEPSRGRVTTEREMGITQSHSQSRYPGSQGEGRSGGGARRERTAVGGVSAMPGNAPRRQMERGVSIEDIRSNFLHDLTGHVVIPGKYAVASGGSGDIYRGSISISGKSTEVAIKVYKMYLEGDKKLPEKMKQFHNEITVWKNLAHPNVLELFGTIRDSNIPMHPQLPALVCPWIQNGSLTGYLERNKSLAIRNRLILINDVAHGLQYLHSQSVVHGDLSGSNVLVHANGRACIADFGLSTLLSNGGGKSFATTRQNKGTVRWMAPELFEPKTIPTLQSDVYSFGTIMLQVLTGDVPYGHFPRDEQVICAIVRGDRLERPAQRVVTNNRWEFVQWCWSRRGRPSGDQIVNFTKSELAQCPADRY